MIIDGIVTLLSTLPYPVSTTPIDPYKVEELPAISVQYAKEDFKSISQDQWYQRETQIVIGVIVAESTTYATTLKTITDLVLNKLLTDPVWFSSFKGVTDINVTYQYEDAGETNYAYAAIAFTLIDNMSFQPVFTVPLNTIHSTIDDISPFDHNLVSIGPDGRAEKITTITLPQ